MQLYVRGQSSFLPPRCSISTCDAAPRQRRCLRRMKELPHTYHCFVCGESNVRGLNLRFQTNGSEVEADYVPAAEHAGFSRTVHGGLLSTVLDEIMVWA